MSRLACFRVGLTCAVLTSACGAEPASDTGYDQMRAEERGHEAGTEQPPVALDAGRSAAPVTEMDSGPRSRVAPLAEIDADVAATDSGTPVPDAGSGSIDATPDGALGAGLPCAVQRVVRERCGRCHGEPPALGAYRPLLTHADFHAPGTSDEKKRYFELAKARINDSANRMPPRSAPALSANELQALNAWLDQGAPAGTERCAAPAAGDGGAGTAATAEEPTARAFATLTRGDRASLERAISELDSALAADPKLGRVSFYAGVFRLWKTTEALDGLGDLLGFLELKEQMVTRLQNAHAMVPEDFRMTGFLGLAQVIGGLATLDDALVEAGKRTIDEGVAQFPAYNYFVRASALSNFARDSPEFAKALPDMFAHAKECGYPVDADGVYHYPSDPKKQPFPTICMNEGIVPHAWEGIFINFGDMMLKSGGGAEKARALYRSAQTAPSYRTWPFAPQLEQRIRDAQTSAEAFTDANPFNDPPLWSSSGNMCVGCHQR